MLTNNVKILFNIFLYLLFLYNFNYGQTDDFLPYYPLNIGDRWDFKVFSEIILDTTYATRIITADTILNDKNYYKYNVIPYDYYYYERIDSASSIVYEYHPKWESERPLYKLDASIGDTLEFGWNTRCIFEGYREILGMNILTKDFISDEIMGFSGYSLSYGFGVTKEYYDGHGPNTYSYLVGAIIDGQSYGTLASVKSIFKNADKIDFKIFNYPNPFNLLTLITYELPKSCIIEITIYNTLGEKITTLFKGYKNKGIYTLEWNAIGLESGIFFITIKFNQYKLIRKCCLVK